MPSAAQTEVLLRVRGVVQGVGFRPFVQRTATDLGLRGWVRNDRQGVLIRVAGDAEAVERLVVTVRNSPPPAARVESVEPAPALADAGEVNGVFQILESGDAADTAVEAAIPPDLALCADCRRELLDPGDRRHRYPFVNCTQCGPRYSIIEGLPYDRPRTTMRAFRMCSGCAREYAEPRDRRFHAQPNACARCGPAVALVARDGEVLASRDAAVKRAAELITAGLIVAVKGVGGYHLMVDATNPRAVAELRRRKHRDEKPFAVMFRDLAAIAQTADISTAARALLESPAAPIVLLPRRDGSALAAEIAPGNPWIGALVAYSPLHVLLLRELDVPVVATSGNLAEEPLCTAAEEAHVRLGDIADAFLDHDRPIAHPVDDSVVRMAGD
jgi:hydrogenase maturation protein HypF